MVNVAERDVCRVERRIAGEPEAIDPRTVRRRRRAEVIHFPAHRQGVARERGCRRGDLEHLEVGRRRELDVRDSRATAVVVRFERVFVDVVEGVRTYEEVIVTADSDRQHDVLTHGIAAARVDRAAVIDARQQAVRAVDRLVRGHVHVVVPGGLERASGALVGHGEVDTGGRAGERIQRRIGHYLQIGRRRQLHADRTADTDVVALVDVLEDLVGVVGLDEEEEVAVDATR